MNDSAAALMCFMVAHGASVDQENEQCRTPLSYVTDMKLKKTLKKIAKGDNGYETKSPFSQTKLFPKTANLPYSDKRKQLLKMKFLVNEQNVSVMYIDINAISLYLC